jgi:methionyl-tRNA formyltransferase
VRLVYLGTPQVAVAPLEALHAAGHEIVLVVSGADKRRGRGRATSPSPVKAAALGLGLPVTARPEDVLDVDAELGVVVAYGRILRPPLLAHVPMVNLHFSLLPRWRGAAPVERAVLAGDDRTGVCVMDVEEELDTGGVHARAEIPIDDRITAEELRAELVDLGARLLVDSLAVGLGAAVPQAAEGVTYAAKLDAEDRHLDWSGPAVQAHRVVRVGGAWTTFRGARCKVIAAERLDPGSPDLPSPPPPPGGLDGVLVGCGDGGALRLVTVQPAGKAPMDAAAWVNGARPAPDERMGFGGTAPGSNPT